MSSNQSSGINFAVTQKQFAIVFIIVTLIAVIWLGYSKFNSSQSAIAPSPSSATQALGQIANQQAQPSQPPQKQIKQYPKFPGELTNDQLKNKKAVIQTGKGNIEFEIYPEATKAASNFVFLAQDKFFDGLTFHRVEPGFVIQGGDPLGNGMGGPGYTFTEDKLLKTKYDKGVVAMAKKGTESAGTGGSQFFIMLEDKPLPPEYVIFGKVTKGQDVVDKIRVGDVMKSVLIENLK